MRQSKQGRSKPVGPPHHRTSMGREQRARMQARIIKAAIPVFASKGVYTPVVTDFVRAARIARGTFYWYFSSVEDLRSSAADSLIGQYVAECDPIIQKISNPVIRFSTAMRIFLRQAKKDPPFAEFVMSQAAPAPMLDMPARRDLTLAIDAELVKIADVDAGLMLAYALMRYASRAIFLKMTPRLGEKEIIRSVLFSWGVSEDLITQALTARLPTINLSRKKASLAIAWNRMTCRK